MADYITIQQLINEAIRTKTTVHIRYRDYHGNISSREISPLEWVESGKILALCHLRNEHRNFNINNIVEISKEVEIGSDLRRVSGIVDRNVPFVIEQLDAFGPHEAR